MGRIVITCYRPRVADPAAAAALLAVVREHVPALQQLGLATLRAPVLMQASDGSLLEVFEWASADAVARAHVHPVVQALWQRFDTVCEHATLASLAETAGLFAEFTPIDD